MKPIFSSVFALALALAFQSASAATINDNALESATPGGDYSDAKGTGPNITSSQPILVGQTTLLGGLRLNCVAGDCSDSSGLRDPSDAFSLTVGANRALTNLVLNIASGNTPAQSISDVSFEIEVSEPTAPTTFGTTLLGETVDYSVIPGLTGAYAFGPGTYDFFIGASGASSDFTGAIDWSLTATLIDTTPVPLPATLPMLLCGLAGVGMMRRKQRSNAAT